MASILLLLLLLFLTSASLTPAAMSKCDAADKRILLQIFAEFGHPPHLSSWHPSTDCCESWVGLTCDMSTGQALDLNFTGAALAGPIPPSIGRLPVLSYLTLTDLPALTGPIPSSFANLTFLKQLTISRTALAGPIPPFLGSMPQLGFLDLSRNHLSGSIPHAFSGLMLYSINLNHNMLSGSIPALYRDYAGPVPNPDLFLSHNRFTGDIPRELGKVDFGFLDLSANRLTGDASFLFGAAKRAQRIDLSRNRLAFDMSRLSFPSQYLEALDLSYNRIWGSIPRSLANLTRLQKFDVSGNLLCGRIPAGGQMDKFGEQSYAGNKCLCGKPLPGCRNTHRGN